MNNEGICNKAVLSAEEGGTGKVLTYSADVYVGSVTQPHQGLICSWFV